MAEETINYVKEDLATFKMGSPEDMGNFITAVIHEGSFDKLASYIDSVKKTLTLKLLLVETMISLKDIL